MQNLKFNEKRNSQNTNFVFETASGRTNDFYDRRRISLDGSGNLTIGELYEVLYC